MDLEDIIQVNTGIGKGIVGFILKKALEKSLGIKFESFTVPELNIHTFGASENYCFSIQVKGNVSKDQIIKLVKGEKE